MHFVTGGAYNGKRQWVKEQYNLDQQTDVTWLSAYPEEETIEHLTESDTFSAITVIEGLELYVRLLLGSGKTDNTCRQDWNSWFAVWNDWERDHAQHRLIVIGNDISKGVVPVDQAIRRWRDYAGWCYQDLTKSCSRVDTIWYGIAKTLKMEA